MYTIKSLSKEKGLSEVYIRRSLRKGTLKGTKVKMKDRNVKRWMISEESYQEFRSQVSSRSRREDGRNKYKIYCTQEERVQLEQLLEEHNLELPFERSNKPKKVS